MKAYIQKHLNSITIRYQLCLCNNKMTKITFLVTNIVNISQRDF